MPSSMVLDMPTSFANLCIYDAGNIKGWPSHWICQMHLRPLRQFGIAISVIATLGSGVLGPVVMSKPRTGFQVGVSGEVG